MSAEVGPRNRAFSRRDVSGYVARSQTVRELRGVVDELRARGLMTTSTGHRQQTNLNECLPYEFTAYPVRAWEYCRVFDILALRPGMRVLDCGGATSPLVFLCASKGIEIVTVELQQWLVDNSREVAAAMGWTTLTAEVGDMTSTGFPDGSFDAVFSISVLEHMPDEAKARAMREQARLLRRGGRAGNTFDFGRSTHARTVYAYQGEDQLHQPIADEAEIMRVIVEPSGLEIFGNLPPFPARVENDVDFIRRVWLRERIRGDRPLGDLSGVMYAHSPFFRSPYFDYTAFSLFLAKGVTT